MTVDEKDIRKAWVESEKRKYDELRLACVADGSVPMELFDALVKAQVKPWKYFLDDYLIAQDQAGKGGEVSRSAATGEKPRSATTGESPTPAAPRNPTPANPFGREDTLVKETKKPPASESPRVVSASPQSAMCTKCGRTPTWRVSVPGADLLEAWCAAHLEAAGLKADSGSATDATPIQMRVVIEGQSAYRHKDWLKERFTAKFNGQDKTWSFTVMSDKLPVVEKDLNDRKLEHTVEPVGAK